MPELPEVEIVRQSLNKKIRQKKVKKVIVRNKNLRIKLPNTFKKVLENKIEEKEDKKSNDEKVVTVESGDKTKKEKKDEENKEAE